MALPLKRLTISWQTSFSHILCLCHGLSSNTSKLSYASCLFGKVGAQRLAELVPDLALNPVLHVLQAEAFGLGSRHASADLYSGIDNNEAPRDDIAKYGDSAVKSGKITLRQLNLIKRAGAAHSNRVENYAVFAAATVLAVATGVPRSIVNSQCLLYSVSSVAYGACYVLIETTPLSLLRTLSWYGGCWACFRLFWEAGKMLNKE